MKTPNIKYWLGKELILQPPKDNYDNYVWEYKDNKIYISIENRLEGDWCARVGKDKYDDECCFCLYCVSEYDVKESVENQIKEQIKFLKDLSKLEIK